MKKLILSFVAIIMVAGLSSKVSAQTVTDMKTNHANASILSDIALTAVHPLEFGAIIASTGGTVIVGTTDNRTKGVGSNVTLILTQGTPPTSGSYTVTGTGNVDYQISIPTTSFDVVNQTGTGGELMPVTAMTCSETYLSPGIYRSAFDSNGDGAFTVGGTLTVGSGQVEGFYTGTFPVTVAY